MSHSDATDSLIAIVGIAGRSPRSKDLRHWWQNLRDGIELTSSFTEVELLAGGVPIELLGNPSYVKSKAVLEDVAEFDAGFSVLALAKLRSWTRSSGYSANVRLRRWNTRDSRRKALRVASASTPARA